MKQRADHKTFGWAQLVYPGDREAVDDCCRAGRPSRNEKCGNGGKSSMLKALFIMYQLVNRRDRPTKKF